MVTDLTALLNFIWNTLDSVVLLYFSGGILTLAFAVWIVKRVSRLFDYIIH